MNPRAVFERLFGPGDEHPATRAKICRYKRSILDGALDDTRRLDGNLVPRRKLDEYMTAVRDFEARIQRAEKDKLQVVPTMDKPNAAPAKLADEARLMYLLVAAFKIDSSRIATLTKWRCDPNQSSSRDPQ